MVKYSFNADMSCVFERLAAAHRTPAAPTAGTQGPLNATRVIPFEPGKTQPRLEIAQVALRKSRHEPRSAAT